MNVASKRKDLHTVGDDNSKPQLIKSVLRIDPIICKRLQKTARSTDGMSAAEWGQPVIDHDRP